ncbi:hypothetical protein, partial [Salmonella sp. SAL4445]|uniref:hypothetical protein n=1 Tax=Salmonella sp. SAL4445 TaxID=3159900 RepID=UPI003978C4A3
MTRSLASSLPYAGDGCRAGCREWEGGIVAGIRVNDRAEPLPLGRRRKKARGDGLCRAEWGSEGNREWR